MHACMYVYIYLCVYIQSTPTFSFMKFSSSMKFSLTFKITSRGYIHPNTLERLHKGPLIESMQSISRTVCGEAAQSNPKRNFWKLLTIENTPTGAFKESIIEEFCEAQIRLSEVSTEQLPRKTPLKGIPSTTPKMSFIDHCGLPLDELPK